MKLSHGLGLLMTCTLLSAGAWVGCSVTTTPITPSPDGGPGNADGGPIVDSGPGNTDSGPGNTDSGPGNTDAGPGDAASSVNCTNYCSRIQTACTGNDQQYASVTECMNACALFPLGSVGDQAGDTLGCRSYHTTLAATTPSPHCWHAGPYGFGGCGAQCDDFCALATTWCSPAMGYSGTPPFADLATCKTACNGFATDDAGANPGAYNANGPTTGNTIDCREYHLGAALSGPADGGLQNTHCGHISVASAPGTCQ